MIAALLDLLDRYYWRNFPHLGHVSNLPDLCGLVRSEPS